MIVISYILVSILAINHASQIIIMIIIITNVVVTA